MDTARLIPERVRDDMAWSVLEDGVTVTETARRFAVPRFVVSDAVADFLSRASEDLLLRMAGSQADEELNTA